MRCTQELLKMGEEKKPVINMAEARFYSYVRVSTTDQDTDRQKTAIAKYCKENNITIPDRDKFEDKLSGKDLNRPDYKRLKDTLRPGDTLIIKEIDRLSRNWADTIEEYHYFEKNGINLVVIELEYLNIKHEPDGTLSTENWVVREQLLILLAYVAQKEREKIRIRQAEGIAKYRLDHDGKGPGRKKIEKHNFTKEQLELLDKYAGYQKTGKKFTNTQLAKDLGLTKTMFYKYAYENKDKLKEIGLTIVNAATQTANAAKANARIAKVQQPITVQEQQADEKLAAVEEDDDENIGLNSIEELDTLLQPTGAYSIDDGLL